MSGDDTLYFSRRATQEFAAAEAASSETTAAIHRELAERFSRLAENVAGHQSAQQTVSNQL